jgi:hypothetical protein
MFCQIYTMTVLRDHYVIDMIGGILIGHYLFIMSERYSYLFDFYVLGIPLEKRLGTIEQNNQASKEKEEGLPVTSNSNLNYNIITCDNCNHPVSQYVSYDWKVVHVPTKED